MVWTNSVKLKIQKLLRLTLIFRYFGVWTFTLHCFNKLSNSNLHSLGKGALHKKQSRSLLVHLCNIQICLEINLCTLPSPLPMTSALPAALKPLPLNLPCASLLLNDTSFHNWWLIHFPYVLFLKYQCQGNTYHYFKWNNTSLIFVLMNDSIVMILALLKNKRIHEVILWQFLQLYCLTVMQNSFTSNFFCPSTL